jgi:hypothetical protein
MLVKLVNRMTQIMVVMVVAAVAQAGQVVEVEVHLLLPLRVLEVQLLMEAREVMAAAVRLATRVVLAALEAAIPAALQEVLQGLLLLVLVVVAAAVLALFCCAGNKWCDNYIKTRQIRSPASWQGASPPELWGTKWLSLIKIHLHKCRGLITPSSLVNWSINNRPTGILHSQTLATLPLI